MRGFCVTQTGFVVLSRANGNGLEGMTVEGREQSRQRSKQLFRRHLRYLIPRMLLVFLPGYDPGKVPVPARIQAALDRFAASSPLSQNT
jgi:hypothetical protein